MDGVEKALQPVGGVPMVKHVRTRLEPQVGHIIVSANHAHEQYRTLLPDDTLVADAVPGLGPLGGIMTAFSVTHSPYLFCCPGDAPFLNEQLVARLAAALDKEAEASVAVPFDGERSQHLFLLMRTSLRHHLLGYVDRGERSVHGFVSGTAPVLVNAADIADSFRNINTLDELAAASRAADHSVVETSANHSQPRPPAASEST
jgi:molybdenum cofactor guanylyltransferase